MVKPKMKAINSDSAVARAVNTVSDWFTKRHNDEQLIDAETDPQKKFELIGHALHNRLLVAHVANRMPAITDPNQEEQHYAPVGDTILTNADTQNLATEFANFLGKYGDFFVKHAKKEGKEDLLDIGGAGNMSFSLPGLFDFAGETNDDFIKEVMNKPEVFGELLRNTQNIEAVKSHWKELLPSVQNKGDQHDHNTLSAALAINGLKPEKIQELGFSKKAAKYYKNIKLYGAIKDNLALAVDPKDAAKFDTIDKSDYHKALYSNRYYAPHNLSKITDPEDISDMMDIAYKHGEDGSYRNGFERVSGVIRAGLNVAPEQWLDLVKNKYKLANTETDIGPKRIGDVKIQPDIPTSFLDNPEHLKTIAQNWDWKNWGFSPSSENRRDAYAPYFSLRDNHPEVLQEIGRKMNELAATDDHRLNHYMHLYSNMFDESGNYRKDVFNRDFINAGMSDPNREKFRDYVGHHVNEALMNPAADKRTEILASNAETPNFMHKMSPQIANSLYALATHYNASAGQAGTKWDRPIGQEANRGDYLPAQKAHRSPVDLEKIFANAMLTRPEYQNLEGASKFWNDYEKEVKAEHFPVAQAALTGEHKSHIPFRKRKYEKGMLNENGEEVFTSKGSEHLWSSLKGHAQLSQSALLMRYIKDKAADESGRVVNEQVVPDKKQAHHPFHAPKFRTINGKLHVKVYRGIAGQHGADIMDTHQQGQPFHTAGIQSFSLDPETASWFALERQKEFNEKHLQAKFGQDLDTYLQQNFPEKLKGNNPYENKVQARVLMPPLVGRAAVVEGWMPVEDIAHFGAVSRDNKEDYTDQNKHMKFKPVHESEQELVFLSRNSQIPHEHFRVHDAHKFWDKLKKQKKSQKRRNAPEDLFENMPGRVSDMPVLDTSFAELIGLSHGHHHKIPDKIFADSLEVTPETKDSLRYKDFQVKPGVVDVKGIPVQTQLPEVKTPEKPARDPLRTRHTMKKSEEEGASDE